jgi:hypothetical protein
MVQRIYNSKEWPNEGTNSTDPFCILFDTSIIDLVFSRYPIGCNENQVIHKHSREHLDRQRGKDAL